MPLLNLHAPSTDERTLGYQRIMSHHTLPWYKRSSVLLSSLFFSLIAGLAIAWFTNEKVRNLVTIFHAVTLTSPPIPDLPPLNLASLFDVKVYPVLVEQPGSGPDAHLIATYNHNLKLSEAFSKLVESTRKTLSEYDNGLILAKNVISARAHKIKEAQGQLLQSAQDYITRSSVRREQLNAIIKVCIILGPTILVLAGIYYLILKPMLHRDSLKKLTAPYTNPENLFRAANHSHRNLLVQLHTQTIHLKHDKQLLELVPDFFAATMEAAFKAIDAQNEYHQEEGAHQLRQLSSEYIKDCIAILCKAYDGEHVDDTKRAHCLRALAHNPHLNSLLEAHWHTIISTLLPSSAPRPKSIEARIAALLHNMGEDEPRSSASLIEVMLGITLPTQSTTTAASLEAIIEEDAQLTEEEQREQSTYNTLRNSFWTNTGSQFQIKVLGRMCAPGSAPMLGVRDSAVSKAERLHRLFFSEVGLTSTAKQAQAHFRRDKAQSKEMAYLLAHFLAAPLQREDALNYLFKLMANASHTEVPAALIKIQKILREFNKTIMPNIAEQFGIIHLLNVSSDTEINRRKITAFLYKVANAHNGEGLVIAFRHTLRASHLLTVGQSTMTVSERLAYYLGTHAATQRRGQTHCFSALFDHRLLTNKYLPTRTDTKAPYLTKQAQWVNAFLNGFFSGRLNTTQLYNLFYMLEQFKQVGSPLIVSPIAQREAINTTLSHPRCIRTLASVVSTEIGKASFQTSFANLLRFYFRSKKLYKAEPQDDWLMDLTHQIREHFMRQHPRVPLRAEQATDRLIAFMLVTVEGMSDQELHSKRSVHANKAAKKARIKQYLISLSNSSLATLNRLSGELQATPLNLGSDGARAAVAPVNMTQNPLLQPRPRPPSPDQANAGAGRAAATPTARTPLLANNSAAVHVTQNPLLQPRPRPPSPDQANAGAGAAAGGAGAGSDSDDSEIGAAGGAGAAAAPEIDQQSTAFHDNVFTIQTLATYFEEAGRKRNTIKGQVKQCIETDHTSEQDHRRILRLCLHPSPHTLTLLERYYRRHAPRDTNYQEKTQHMRWEFVLRTWKKLYHRRLTPQASAKLLQPTPDYPEETYLFFSSNSIIHIKEYVKTSSASQKAKKDFVNSAVRTLIALAKDIRTIRQTAIYAIYRLLVAQHNYTILRNMLRIQAQYRHDTDSTWQDFNALDLIHGEPTKFVAHQLSQLFDYDEDGNLQDIPLFTLAEYRTAHTMLHQYYQGPAHYIARVFESMKADGALAKAMTAIWTKQEFSREQKQARLIQLTVSLHLSPKFIVTHWLQQRDSRQLKILLENNLAVCKQNLNFPVVALGCLSAGRVLGEISRNRIIIASRLIQFVFSLNTSTPSISQATVLAHYSRVHQQLNAITYHDYQMRIHLPLVRSGILKKPEGRRYIAMRFMHLCDKNHLALACLFLQENAAYLFRENGYNLRLSSVANVKQYFDADPLIGRKRGNLKNILLSVGAKDSTITAIQGRIESNVATLYLKARCLKLTQQNSLMNNRNNPTVITRTVIQEILSLEDNETVTLLEPAFTLRPTGEKPVTAYYQCVLPHLLIRHHDTCNETQCADFLQKLYIHLNQLPYQRRVKLMGRVLTLVTPEKRGEWIEGLLNTVSRCSQEQQLIRLAALLSALKNTISNARGNKTTLAGNLHISEPHAHRLIRLSQRLNQSNHVPTTQWNAPKMMSLVKNIRNIMKNRSLSPTARNSQLRTKVIDTLSSLLRLDGETWPSTIPEQNAIIKVTLSAETLPRGTTTPSYHGSLYKTLCNHGHTNWNRLNIIEREERRQALLRNLGIDVAARATQGAAATGAAQGGASAQGNTTASHNAFSFFSAVASSAGSAAAAASSAASNAAGAVATAAGSVAAATSAFFSTEETFPTLVIENPLNYDRSTDNPLHNVPFTPDALAALNAAQSTHAAGGAGDSGAAASNQRRRRASVMAMTGGVMPTPQGAAERAASPDADDAQSVARESIHSATTGDGTVAGADRPPAGADRPPAGADRPRAGAGGPPPPADNIANTR